MEQHSKRLAGILLVILPTVLYGGVSLLTFLIDDSAYIQIHCGRICFAQDMHMPVCC